jgi:glycosyltransferase involved in cell wall biosynthesis
MHVIAQLPVGGAEVMLQKLLARCDRSRFDFAVITLSRRKGELAPAFESMGVPVFSAGMGRIPGPFSFWKLIRQIRAWKPDILQGWMPHGNLAALMTRRFVGKKPVILSVRQSLHDLLSDRPMTRAIIRRVGRVSHRAAKIVYNSHIGAEQHQRLGYDASRALILPNGFDCNIFQPDTAVRASVRRELNITDDQRLIGLVGRLDPIKDHPIFFKAGSKICSEFNSARLVCVGDGPEKYKAELLALSEKLGIADRVLWLGARKDVPRVTNALDIAVSASFSEGFCNAIGEAMACAVPCVVTDVGESSRIVADTGKVVPPKDPTAFAQACSALLNIPEEQRLLLGQKARARIIQYYELNTITAAYQDLYSSILKEKSS